MITYSVMLNDKTGQAPDKRETTGLSRGFALECVVDLVRALCSGDALAYGRWMPNPDNTNETVLVYHHGGVDIIDMERNQ